MKLRNMTVLGLALSMTTLSAHASIVGSAGTWQGTGASFGLDGNKTGDFQIEMTNTATDAHTIKTEGKITYPDGMTKEFSQEMKDNSGTGFSISSPKGKGGGYCFGEGLCESYIAAPDGSAVAVTTVLDGKSEVRTLITVLDTNGKAVLFLREKTVRK